MSRRFLSVAAVVLASVTSAVILKPAQAATTTATFNGSVAKTCVFGAATAGVMAEGQANGSALTNRLASDTVFGGTPATVQVSCNDDFNVTVTQPVFTAAPSGFVPANYSCDVAFDTAIPGGSAGTGIGGACGGSNTASATVGVDQTVNAGQLNINTSVFNGPALPAGAYTLTVNVDATPN